MFPLGGVIGILLGLFNEWPRIRKMNVFFHALFGTLLIFILEFGSGIILNIFLRFNIWDHSEIPLNLLGQIALPYAIVWFFLCPFVFWLDDYLKFVLYKKGNPYNLCEVYKDLLKITKKTNYQN